MLAALLANVSDDVQGGAGHWVDDGYVRKGPLDIKFGDNEEKDWEEEILVLLFAEKL